ncbi:MAG: 2-amino-4-hydroxy-6-hydroxymethyldihydropteridine diphosphokinase [Bacteroidales bacterium]|nr:2-amino-4-hydroxy-6-hydroxymethyldihydropteridine diphosphokinase [Bacteroidales bacterium]
MVYKKIVLLLGGNEGDTRGYLRNAITLLEQQLGMMTHQSYFYKTAAWGFEAEDFINIGLVIETDKSAEECLQATQDVEDELGRIKEDNTQGYQDRNIDVDIIFYGDEIINTAELVIPHPRMQERNFVLQPLLEIIPEFQHPVFKKSIKALATECLDDLEATPLNEQV